jgi:hypothetical protein
MRGSTVGVCVIWTLLAWPFRASAEDIPYRLLPSSLLGHLGPDGTERALQLSGTFVFRLEQQSGGAVGGLLLDMQFTTAGGDYTVSGEGQYLFGLFAGAETGAVRAEARISVNGSPEVHLTTEVSGGNAEFPIISVSLQDIDPSGADVFALLLRASPVDEAIGLFFRRGDIDGDGGVTIADAIFLALHLFCGGNEPTCIDSSDVDDDGRVEINDAVFLLNHLFRGGSEPPPPFVLCGVDQTEDDLDCQGQPPCMG